MSDNDFVVDQFVVYPSHGVGKITAIEEQEIAGISMELFVIDFAKDKMTLRVPTAKATSVGMRSLANPDLVSKAMATLRGRARVKRAMWSRRAQEYEQKINSGDLIAIAEVVRDKRVEGISDIRDISDRHGIRVVIELKKDAEADVILNQLYKFTPLQSSFGCNMVCLNSGKPELLSIRQIIDAFLEFRVDIVVKRSTYLLNKSRDRAHVLVGLAIAIANIDIPSFYTSSGVFDTDVTAYGSTTIDVLDCNAVIDTSKKVLDNVREIVKGMRGYLPYVQGKYKLVIETTGTASVSLTEDDIIGGYALASPTKNSKYNRVIASFINPDRNYQVDEIQFPPIDDSGLASADQHATMKTADGGFLLSLIHI